MIVMVNTRVKFLLYCLGKSNRTICTHTLTHSHPHSLIHTLTHMYPHSLIAPHRLCTSLDWDKDGDVLAITQDKSGEYSHT